MSTKKKNLLIVLIITLLCQYVNAVSFVPVLRESTSKWFLIDKKGHKFHENIIQGEPFYSREGTFVVQGDDKLWSVFEYGKEHPRLIADKLVGIGDFSEGVMAVVRKDKPIEIIDKSGKVVLTLDSLQGRLIVRCGLCHYGRITVITLGKKGEEKMGMVDLKGNVICEPVYDDIVSCPNGAYITSQTDRSSSWKNVYKIHDSKGNVTVYEGRSTGKNGGLVRINDEYVSLDTDTAKLLINQKSMKTVMTLSAECSIDDIYKNYLLYEKAGEHYIVNISKNKLLFKLAEDPYFCVVLTDKGILAGPGYGGEEKMSLFSYDGKLIKVTDWIFAETFGDMVIAHKKNLHANPPEETKYYLFDNKLKQIDSESFCEVNLPFAALEFEYSPVRKTSDDMLCGFIMEEIRTMVDSGMIEGRTTQTKVCDKMIFSGRGTAEEISRDARKNSNNVVTEAMIYCFSEKSDMTLAMADFYKVINEKMAASYEKISEGVFVDKGVYYTVRNYNNSVRIYVSDSKGAIPAAYIKLANGKIWNSETDSISKEQFEGASLVIRNDKEPYDVHIDVVKFKVSIPDGRGGWVCINSDGNKFSDGQIRMIKNLKSGDVISLTNIEYTGVKSGTGMPCKPVILK